MKEIKYLINGVEKNIIIFDSYKNLLEKHQINHIVIKMYNQIFLNFDEYTFLHSIHDSHSNINERLYFVNKSKAKENVFFSMYNYFKNKNNNYIYEYIRHYIDNTTVSIEQKITRV